MLRVTVWEKVPGEAPVKGLLNSYQRRDLASSASMSRALSMYLSAFLP